MTPSGNRARDLPACSAVPQPTGPMSGVGTPHPTCFWGMYMDNFIFNLYLIRYVDSIQSGFSADIRQRISKTNGIFNIEDNAFNTLNPKLNPICYLLALLGAHHFFHVSRIMVKSLTLRLLMSYIYGAHILDVSRSHTTTHHSR